MFGFKHNQEQLAEHHKDGEGRKGRPNISEVVHGWGPESKQALCPFGLARQGSAASLSPPWWLLQMRS